MIREKSFKSSQKKGGEKKMKRMLFILIALCTLFLLASSAQAIDMNIAQNLGTNQERVIRSYMTNVFGVVVSQYVSTYGHYADPQGNQFFSGSDQNYGMFGGQAQLSQVYSEERQQGPQGWLTSTSNSTVNYSYDGNGALYNAGGLSYNISYTRDQGGNVTETSDSNTTMNYGIFGSDAVVIGTSSMGYNKKIDVITGQEQVISSTSGTSTNTNFMFAGGTYKAQTENRTSFTLYNQVIGNQQRSESTSTTKAIGYDVASGNVTNAYYTGGSGGGWGFHDEALWFNQTLDLANSVIYIENGRIAGESTQWIRTQA